MNAAAAVKITPVALHIPERWVAPSNPCSREVEVSLERWFREIGVIHDARTAEVFRRLDVGGYGGLPFPLASRDALEAMGAVLSLWIYYDDAIEGAGARDEEALIGALSGAPDLLHRDTPCLRGFRAIGARFAARMSAGWRTRHAADFSAWVRSVDAEALLARRFRSAAGRVRVEEHLALREINVGMIPVIDWIELDLGAELPMDVYACSAMDDLVRAACRVVAMNNELYGYSKDRSTGWINMIACAEREGGVSMSRAFARIADLHDRAVEEMVVAGEELLQAASDRALVEAWLVRLQHIVAGFATWHARAPRYDAVHTSADGTERVELILARP